MRLYTTLLSTLLFVVACQSDTNSNTANDTKAERMDNATFAQKLQTTTNPILIDVRTPQEVQAGKLEGAINYDYHGSDFEKQLQALNKSQATFIYCQSGGRSGKTLARMKSMGFKEVYELRRGYSAWDKK